MSDKLVKVGQNGPIRVTGPSKSEWTTLALGVKHEFVLVNQTHLDLIEKPNGGGRKLQLHC
jgi:hypothetical protein